MLGKYFVVAFFFALPQLPAAWFEPTLACGGDKAATRRAALAGCWFVGKPPYIDPHIRQKSTQNWASLTCTCHVLIATWKPSNTDPSAWHSGQATSDTRRPFM